jgi:L-galactonate 5-dehydrogenase
MKAFAIKEKKIIGEINIEQPKMRPEEVLIEVHYLGLCGSDLNSYRGLMPLVTLPRIPGHEISGVIVDKGEAVPGNFQLGDKVTVSPYTSCGVCPACRIGRYNTCESNQTLGVQRDGALTKLISIPFDKVFVNNTLSLIELALVEPFSVGYHGANRGKVSETDTVLLLGCGTIGIGALVAAVRKGARVIALDIDDTKLEQAKKFGAFYAINSSKTDALAEIRSITNNRGVNVVIEAVGTQSTYKLALDAVCFAGRIVLIGYSKNELTMDTSLIVRKELNMYGSRNALQVFPSVISMFEMKGKPYSELITKIFPFAQAPEAFRFWDENTTGVSKILIDVKK